MMDYGTLTLVSSTKDEFLAHYKQVLPTLPLEWRRKLQVVRSSYAISHRADVIFEKFNGRTIATILAEFDEFRATQPEVVVAEGEVNGVSYRLTRPDAPEMPPRGEMDHSISRQDDVSQSLQNEQSSDTNFP